MVGREMSLHEEAGRQGPGRCCLPHSPTPPSPMRDRGRAGWEFRKKLDHERCHAGMPVCAEQEGSEIPKQVRQQHKIRGMACMV